MHIKNFTKAEKGHILTHNNNADVRSRLKHIDKEKTKLNYNLCPREEKAIEYWDKRYKETTHSNQKKTTVLTDMVLTLPKEVPLNKSREFFETSFKFIKQRYGAENIVQAVVHMDEEGQPHLHTDLIPVDANGRCSARGVFSKTELKQMHIDLQKYLDENLSFSACVLNGSTANGNKTVQELKSQSLAEKVEQEKRIYNFLKSENQKLKNENVDIPKLKNENEELKKMLSNTVSAKKYNEVVKAYNSKTQEVKEYKEYVDEFETYLNKKGLFRDFLNYSTNQNENQKNKHFDIEK